MRVVIYFVDMYRSGLDLWDVFAFKITYFKESENFPQKVNRRFSEFLMSDKFFTSKICVNLRFFRTYRKISGK